MHFPRQLINNKIITFESNIGLFFPLFEFNCRNRERKIVQLLRFNICSLGLLFFSLTLILCTHSDSTRNATLMPDTKRVNILVISFPRSELIFISGVFYLFEPLQAVQKLLCSSLISHPHLIKICYSNVFRILTTVSLPGTSLPVTSTGKTYVNTLH